MLIREGDGERPPVKPDACALAWLLLVVAVLAGLWWAFQ
jgi:hypothetical protein